MREAVQGRHTVMKGGKKMGIEAGWRKIALSVKMI